MSAKGQVAAPWATQELATLRRIYPTGGLTACRAALPKRSLMAIRARVSALGLRLDDDVKSAIFQRKPAAHRWPWPPRPAVDDLSLAWAARRERRAA